MDSADVCQLGSDWSSLVRAFSTDSSFFTRIQRYRVYLDVFNRFSFMNFVETSTLDLT